MTGRGHQPRAWHQWNGPLKCICGQVWPCSKAAPDPADPGAIRAATITVTLTEEELALVLAMRLGGGSRRD